MGELSRGSHVMAKSFASVAEAEDMTGISRWTWRRWAYDGRIASTKLGTRLLVPIAEIERLVAEGTRLRRAGAKG
jgi:excisionase family DNA binding protein